MAILKSEIRNKFSTIPNSVIRAEDVTDAEYRLMIYLYSLPNGWKINQGYLGEKLNCSRVNINKKIRQLKEKGYLEIIRANKNNPSDYIYVLKEKDVSLNDVSLSDVSPSDVSLSDTHINNNIINTEIINTNINNTTTTTESLLEFVEKTFGRPLGSGEIEHIITWEDNEITRYAIKQCELARVFTIPYIESILSSYKKDNIVTLSQIEEREKRFRENKIKRYKKNIIPVPNWVNKNFKKERNLTEEDEQIIKKLKGSN